MCAGEREGTGWSKELLLLLLENLLIQKQNTTGESPKFHSCSNSIIEIKFLQSALMLASIKIKHEKPHTDWQHLGMKFSLCRMESLAAQWCSWNSSNFWMTQPPGYQICQESPKSQCAGTSCSNFSLSLYCHPCDLTQTNWLCVTGQLHHPVQTGKRQTLHE